MFSRGKAFYPIERINTATEELFDDGEHILYVNGEYRDESEIGKLMHDFSCWNPDDMHFELLRDTTRYYKENPKGVEIMCRAFEQTAGKPSSDGISALYTDPFFLRNHLPKTMCLWSCDLAFALFLDSSSRYSQNDILSELEKKRDIVPCTDCPYHPSQTSADNATCPDPHEHMTVPNHRKTINRLLKHIPPQMILYARKGYREWRAQYGLFVMRERPLLVSRRRKSRPRAVLERPGAVLARSGPPRLLPDPVGLYCKRQISGRIATARQV